MKVPKEIRKELVEAQFVMIMSRVGLRNSEEGDGISLYYKYIYPEVTEKLVNEGADVKIVFNDECKMLRYTVLWDEAEEDKKGTVTYTYINGYFGKDFSPHVQEVIGALIDNDYEAERGYEDFESMELIVEE